MGKVPWYQAQSVRKGVLDVGLGPSVVRRYSHLHRAFGNQYHTWGDASGDDDSSESGSGDSAEVKAKGFIRVPSGRGRIADNLVLDRPWYADLFAPLSWDRPRLEEEREKSHQRPGQKGKTSSIERLWFKSLSYQRRPLMELIQEDEMWDSEEERTLVEVFWDTLRSLYRQEAEAAKRGGSRSVEKRFEHLYEDIYRVLMRSKTRNLLRSTLSELFAKGGRRGRQPSIQQNSATVWNLIDDPHDWKRARDLCLLALATYRKREGDPWGEPDEDRGDQP
jgi:CRISPR-associated protein Cas8a1/Csx13